MTQHGMTRRRIGIAVVALGAVALVAPTLDANAGSRNRRASLRLLDVSVDGRSDVALNEVIVLRFNRAPRRNSVRAESIQIRGADTTGTVPSREVRGEFEVIGKFVRFRPRLPTHMIGPDERFPAAGSPEDALAQVPELSADTDYEIRVLAKPRRQSVRDRRGRRLRRTVTSTFRTGPGLPSPTAFSTLEYLDAPPPTVSFSNPPDVAASARDQYAFRGGVPDVPRNASTVTLFLNRVPLDVASVRPADAVGFDVLELDGDPADRRPFPGTPYVEQSHDSVRLQFVLDQPLPPLSTFSLRVNDMVRDLSGQFAVRRSEARARVGDIYRFLDAARGLNPAVPVEFLPDPPIDLIPDWPDSPEERAVLKRNLLDLGDSDPDEVDPNVMLIFTSAD